MFSVQHATTCRAFFLPPDHTLPGEKILRRSLEIPQKLLPLLMESHPSGDPLRRGKRTAQNRTPNPSFTFFREYRTSEMKRQTRFCRLFTVCLFVASVNVVTNRKLTSYKAFLHRKVPNRTITSTQSACRSHKKEPHKRLFYKQIPNIGQLVEPFCETILKKMDPCGSIQKHLVTTGSKRPETDVDRLSDDKTTDKP